MWRVRARVPYECGIFPFLKEENDCDGNEGVDDHDRIDATTVIDSFVLIVSGKRGNLWKK
jgi:hypothetical protein